MYTSANGTAGPQSGSASGSPEVVLLNPPAEVIRELFYDQPRYPAIGIGYIASYLVRHGPVVPTVIDSKLDRIDPNETVDAVVALSPRVLGISAMTHMVKTSARIAARIKEKLPDLKVVLGGFHATFLPERTIEEFPIFDYLVVGEGEIAFAKLVDALLSNQTGPTIPGVWYREGSIVSAGRGEIPSTLDELGSPSWHLFQPIGLRELEPTRAAFGIMVPYPGTHVWEMVVRGQGGCKKISTDWDEYNKHFGNAVELDGLPAHVLDVLKLAVYLYVFFPNEESERLLSAIRIDVPHEASVDALGEHIGLVKSHGLDSFPASDPWTPTLRQEILAFADSSFERISKEYEPRRAQVEGVSEAVR